MPTYFVINNLEDEYTWKDFEIQDLIYDYAYDVHNIPEEYIDCIDVSSKSKKVEITIVEDKNIIDEDWYYCLLKYAV